MKKPGGLLGSHPSCRVEGLPGARKPPAGAGVGQLRLGMLNQILCGVTAKGTTTFSFGRQSGGFWGLRELLCCVGLSAFFWPAVSLCGFDLLQNSTLLLQVGELANTFEPRIFIPEVPGTMLPELGSILVPVRKTSLYC